MTHGFSTHRAARPAVCSFAALFISGAVALAGPSGGGYDLSWNTVDSGGGASSGGTYSITGTIGQCDAPGAPGGAPMTGGGYTLTGGFWSFAAPAASPPCPADFDGSHTVNGLDLAQLLGQWSGAASYSPCPRYKPQDLNHDCKVNGLDLALLLGAWGPCS